MKNFLQAIFLLVMSVYCQPLLGQYLPNSFKTSLIPPSPNAAALGQYGDVPVSYYSGLAQIEIPLFEAKERSLSVPVTLSYHASGIKVDQAPTWVGLGWVLNAGGVVTRNIVGKPDEFPNGFIHYMTSPEDIKQRFDEEAWKTVGENLAGNQRAWNYFNYAKNLEDSAPDEFTFNIGGKVGKFILTREGKALTNSKIKIEFELEQVNSSLRNFKHFIITLENGVKHVFSYKESVLSRADTYPFSSGDIGTQTTSSWYLTKIVSPDEQSQIELEYTTPYTYNQFGGLNYSTLQKFMRAFPDESHPNCDGTYGYEQEYGWIYTHQYDMVCLSKIRTSNYEIQFMVTDNEYQYYIRKKLSLITVYDKLQQKESKRYEFTYEPYGRKFHLGFMAEKAADTKVYRFAYDQTPLAWADPISKGAESKGGIDYFGYYNGPKPTYSSRLPRGQIDAQYLDGLDRMPNAFYTGAGILKKITYPTGGYSEFEYEPNDYSYVNNTLKRNDKYAAGGLRIKSITSHDGYDYSKDVVKTYSYVSAENPSLSSGVISYEPHESFLFSHHFPASAYNGGFKVYQQYSQPFRPIDVGYGRVIETLHDGSKTIYQFTTAREYPDVAYIGDGTFFGLAPANQDALYTTKMKHPFLKYPRLYDYMRGLVKEKRIISASNQTLEITENSYISKYLGEVYAFYVFGHDFYYCMERLPGTIWYLHHHKVGVGRAELTAQVKKVYDQNEPSKFFTTKTDYSYSWDHLQLIGSFTTNSKGEYVSTYYKYPQDYLRSMNSNAPSNQALSILNLINKNILNVVIEKYTQKQINYKPKVVSGEVNIYNPTTPYVAETYQLSIDPIGNFTPAYFTSANEFKIDARYKLIGSMDYDAFGNAVSIIKADYAPTALLWSYTSSLPVAEVINASPNQLFYTSFEEEGTEDFQGAKTGRKLYNSGAYTVPFTPPSDGKEYLLSYWYFADNKWQYREKPYSSQISEGSKLDEIRVFPKGSFMSTYTYDPLMGMTSRTGPDGITQYFRYDGSARLTWILDDKKNFLQNFFYYYRGQSYPE